MKRIPIPTVITGIVLVLILVIYSITYQVRFSEAVVKVRFGKPKDVVTDPGLKLKWPYPIETVRNYDTRLRVLDTPETEIKTVDAQNVIVGCFAIWRIEDPLLFSISVPAERTAEDKLRDRINESRAKIIGQHSWSDFVNLDSELVAGSYEQIESEILQDCASGILSDYGVELRRVGVRRISLPEETTSSVQKSMQQERNRMAARYREEGESLKEAIIARADSQSRQILAFAERKAKEIEAAGVKASERIFEQIPQEDTEFFVYLRRLEALEAAFKQGATIFLDADSEVFEWFVKPQDEMLISERKE
ncbi:MAG: protease modulator HflC [Planctomycetes bacterium]|nr:protease modulator HflC [Planctomycetota bacterium]